VYLFHLFPIPADMMLVWEAVVLTISSLGSKCVKESFLLSCSLSQGLHLVYAYKVEPVEANC